jgi:hypothetical protein
MSQPLQLTKEQFEYLKTLGDAFGDSPIDMTGVIAMNAASRVGSTPYARYEAFMKAYSEMRASRDPRVQRSWQEANDFYRQKEVKPGTVHNDATLSNVSIQYANEAFIGESLLPVVPVGKESDIYFIYPRGERMQVPDGTLGDRGRAPEIKETREEGTYTCRQFGFGNFVSQRTLNNQDAPLDEMVDLVESVSEMVAYQREKTIATMMCATATFGTGQYTTLTGANRWDDVSGGNPIKDLLAAKAAIWRGRGASTLMAYSDLDVYNVVCRHQAILDLYKYNGSSPGLATPGMIAGFFGISRYLVGEARSNTATEGDADVYGRLWSKVFGIVRVATRPSRRNASFGYTLRHGQPITAVEYDRVAGHGGGYWAQVTVSEVQKIVAQACGYLVYSPIS